MFVTCGFGVKGSVVDHSELTLANEADKDLSELIACAKNYLETQDLTMAFVERSHKLSTMLKKSTEDLKEVETLKQRNAEKIQMLKNVQGFLRSSKQNMAELSPINATSESSDIRYKYIMKMQQADESNCRTLKSHIKTDRSLANVARHLNECIEELELLIANAPQDLKDLQKRQLENNNELQAVIRDADRSLAEYRRNNKELKQLEESSGNELYMSCVPITPLGEMALEQIPGYLTTTIGDCGRKLSISSEAKNAHSREMLENFSASKNKMQGELTRLRAAFESFKVIKKRMIESNNILPVWLPVQCTTPFIGINELGNDTPSSGISDDELEHNTCMQKLNIKNPSETPMNLTASTAHRCVDLHTDCYSDEQRMENHTPELFQPISKEKSNENVVDTNEFAGLNLQIPVSFDTSEKFTSANHCGLENSPGVDVCQTFRTANSHITDDEEHTQRSIDCLQDYAQFAVEETVTPISVVPDYGNSVQDVDVVAPHIYANFGVSRFKARDNSEPSVSIPSLCISQSSGDESSKMSPLDCCQHEQYKQNEELPVADDKDSIFQNEKSNRLMTDEMRNVSDSICKPQNLQDSIPFPDTDSDSVDESKSEQILDAVLFTESESDNIYELNSILENLNVNNPNAVSLGSSDILREFYTSDQRFESRMDPEFSTATHLPRDVQHGICLAEPSTELSLGISIGINPSSLVDPEESLSDSTPLADDSDDSDDSDDINVWFDKYQDRLERRIMIKELQKPTHPRPERMYSSCDVSYSYYRNSYFNDYSSLSPGYVTSGSASKYLDSDCQLPESDTSPRICRSNNCRFHSVWQSVGVGVKADSAQPITGDRQNGNVVETNSTVKDKTQLHLCATNLIGDSSNYTQSGQDLSMHTSSNSSVLGIKRGMTKVTHFTKPGDIVSKHTNFSIQMINNLNQQHSVVFVAKPENQEETQRYGEAACMSVKDKLIECNETGLWTINSGPQIHINIGGGPTNVYCTDDDLNVDHTRHAEQGEFKASLQAAVAENTRLLVESFAVMRGTVSEELQPFIGEHINAVEDICQFNPETNTCLKSLVTKSPQGVLNSKTTLTNNDGRDNSFENIGKFSDAYRQRHPFSYL